MTPALRLKHDLSMLPEVLSSAAAVFTHVCWFFSMTRPEFAVLLDPKWKLDWSPSRCQLKRRYSLFIMLDVSQQIK